MPKPTDLTPRALPGRPTDCTPERQARVIQAIIGGAHFETACRYAGIAPETGQEWIRRGEGRDRWRGRSEQYAAFATAVRNAEAQLEVTVIAQVRQQLPDVPKLGLDFLARRFPDRWANREKVEHSGPQGGPIPLQVVEQIVTRRHTAGTDDDPTTVPGAG